MKLRAYFILDAVVGIGVFCDAGRVGYESVLSFSNAFKQWANIPLGQYRSEKVPCRQIS